MCKDIEQQLRQRGQCPAGDQVCQLINDPQPVQCQPGDQTCAQQQGGNNCQLTAEQQLQQIRNEQAANETLFQQLFMQALAEQAALKTASAVAAQQINGQRSLSAQNISDLVKNGTLSPADLAIAYAQAAQKLAESGGNGSAPSTTCGQNPGQQIPPGTAGQDKNYSTSDPNGPSSADPNNPPASNPSPGAALDPLAAAADPNVDLSKINPNNITWRETDVPVYRSDSRSPTEIFPDGFQPKDINGNYDLQDWVDNAPAGPYVSTTSSPEGVGKTTMGLTGWFYEITPPAGTGIDMNATAQPGFRPNFGEDEVLFPGGINTRYIKSAREWGLDSAGNEVPLGPVVKNRKYAP